MGAVTPVGNTVPQFWAALKQGACGIAPISAYDSSGMAAKLAGEVHIDIEAHIKPADARKMDRFTQLAVIAAREALAQSGIDAGNTDMERAEVVVSSGIGGLASTEREYERGKARGFDRVSPFYIPMTIANIAAGRIAIESGFRGDCSCIVTACASSTHALGEAARHIRHGYADVALAGGAEAVVIPLAMGGFTSMQALYTGSDPSSASIPFDRRRSGFVLGEGAGILVLEEYDHARARSAHIYAELAGFAATCDAYHMTAPDPSGRGATRAMQAAIADAGLATADIGYINAHGTSTPLNDKCEAAAIHMVFGEDRGNTPPVSSTKSSTGHLLGAVGAVEAIVCALAIQDSYLPPTVNYREPDPCCDLDIITGPGRHSAIQAALSNSLGFGGHNATLVFKAL
jgi:3-oxoacyl-[acyl-carrier-protein] synthase II